jgi:hypothetical protein
MSKEVAKRATDAKLDARVRVKLIGALQLRAEPKLARETFMNVLASEAPEAVRQRAAYAIARVVDKDDVKPLLKAIEKEADAYVTARLAFTLNKLTGYAQNIDQIGKSNPGERGEYIKNWQEAPKGEEKKTAAALQ